MKNRSNQLPSLIERLYSLNRSRGIQLGLKVIQQLDELLGYPSRQFRSIHVAGTNGKGSVCTMLAAAHQAAGFKTGLFTSPHLHTFRERIRINGVPISEEWVEKHLTRLMDVCDQKAIPATFFELTTALGFLAFAEMEVDIAVIEVGIGGRLDATNIIHPELCVITSIGLDHCEILGETVEKITLEKAGIIKPKVPVVIGPQVPYSVIAPFAQKLASRITQVHGTFESYLEENQAIAKEAMEQLGLPKEAIKQGLLKRPSCRLELYTSQELSKHTSHPLPDSIVFDVAHNPAGIEQLVKALAKFPNKRWQLVCGFSRDKEIRSCIRTLLPHVTHVYPVAADSPRSLPADELVQLWQEEGMPKERISYSATKEETFAMALEGAKEAGDSLLVCGTFLIMTPIFQFLNLPCDADPLMIQEMRIGA